MSYFKEPAWRSPDYLAWVRTQLCEGCGQYGRQHAHHNIANRYGSAKTSDAWALPLCSLCHTKLHSDWPAWEAVNGTQDRTALVMLNRALVNGVLELNKRKLREAA